MNRTLAIAARELADRRIIFITAAVLAALPFALLLLPGITRFGRSSVIALTGGVVAASFVTGLALVLGGTFVGRELSDKRLSFYFSKPLSGSAIWFGKLAAAVATLIISLAIVVVPVFLTTGAAAADQGWLGDAAQLLAAFTVFAVVLLLLAHAISTMARSRSLLVLGDIVAAAAVAGAAYTIVRALMAGSAVRLTIAFGAAFAAVLLVTLIAGGARQLSRGRIEARRNHLELSKFVWISLGAAVVVAGAVTAWIVSAPLWDLRAVYAEHAARSEWVLVSGAAKQRGDYRAAFYVNLENGAVARADAGARRWLAAFSGDGRAAVQMNYERRGSAGTLELVRFGDKDVQVTPADVSVPPRAAIVLNGDGTRVATVFRENLAIHSLPDRRTLAAARLPLTARTARLFFVTDDVVRIYLRHDNKGVHAVEIFELDVPARRLTRTGEFAEPGRGIFFNATADGSKLLVRVVSDKPDSAGVLRMRDARTGAELAVIAASTERSQHGAILQDGRVATVSRRAGTPIVAVYTATGALEREIELPPASQMPAFRELSSGKLLVTARGGSTWQTFVADLKSGAVIAGPKGVRVAQTDFFGYHNVDPRHFATAADRVALIAPDSDSLLAWNVSTGETRNLSAAP